MYAVIRTGGKQYRVAPGDVITVEKLAGAAGDTVALTEVLAIGEGAEIDIGAPLLAGATVAAEVLEQGKADKILVFKKKRRKNYRRLRGHRQLQTRLKITEIQAAKKAAPKKKAAAKKAPETPPEAAGPSEE